MRAFSAIATMIRAIIAMPSETRKPTSPEARKPAMVESWVEPATSARVNTIISMAGSASEAIMTSRLEPMPPKARADVEAGEREEEARAAEKRDDGDEIGRPGEHQAGAKGRHQRRRDPGRGEDQIRNDAEQPGGIIGQHHVLAQEPDEVAVRLNERGTLPAQQPRLHLAHEAREQRRERENQQHLGGLHRKIEDQGHIASTSRRPTRATKTKLR